MACPHARGEYSDDYRHCLDCGREWTLIGDAWFEIEAWVRISDAFLVGEDDARSEDDYRRQ